VGLIDLSFDEKQALALRARCPLCEARPGDRCYRGYGYRRDAHVERVLAAARAKGIKRGV
jgi:hypothetical protein